ncbi:MAG: hypothetical protein H6713_36015 [Myxococcales bacterium]|nr:hypothetical protein [Myxococcales bacterium]MCB9755377.1 hypothetical protein [Myxococcales bacterium]
MSAPRAPLRLLPLALLLACQPAANVERPAGAGSEAVATPQPSLAKGALLSIASDEYGAFSPAPGALGVGDKAPDFELPLSTGEMVRMSAANPGGDLVVVFYRGFW